MSSNSSPPPATEPQQSQSADNNTSPFRSILENPRTLTSKQRSPRTPSYTSLTLSPQPPPRPSSVFPTLLGSLSPTPNSNAAATAITTTTATIVKIDPSPSPTRSRKSNSISPTPQPSNTATRPNTPICVPSSPPSVHSSNGSTSAAAPQQFCLRWNNYQSNLTSVFDQLLQNESFVDVTLACDGRSIKAHKMVLSACSPYFQMLFSDTPCRHPIVIMRDVSWPDLKAIVEFMYKGEINVSQEQIGPLLRIAEMLKVRGLADVNGAAAAGGIGVNVEQHVSGERAPKVEPQLIASPRERLSTASPELIGKLLDDSKLVADDRVVPEDSFLSFVEPEKKLRTSRGDWDTVETTTSSGNNNLEMRLSPQLLQHHQQQQQVARNVRKRRWPSSDTIFNPPSSPLSGLIAAERAEREREREREHALMTPPITSSSSAAAHVNSSRLTPAVMHEMETPLDLPSPTPLSASRTPSAAPSSSPHLMHHQQQQHQQQHHSSLQHHTQQHHGSHHSHRSSPASSSTSNTPHPSSVLSNPLTPSPASTIPAVGHGDGRFPPLGHAQAAAMAAAAAAAQMDSMGLSGMGMSHHPPPIAQQSVPSTHHTSSIVDDMEIKPGIAEMIREEERVSFDYKHSLYYSFTK